jgi:ADP-ribose diphosphatase
MSRVVYKHKWMMICEDKYETPYFDMSPCDGAMVVALTESGDLILLSEFSPAYDRHIYYLPSGTLEDDSPSVTANRELQEEAGFKAARLDALGEIYPFMKYMCGRFHVFLARDLTPSKLEGDETTEIIVEPTPFADFENLIASGQIQDSSVIASLYMARSFLAKEKQT